VNDTFRANAFTFASETKINDVFINVFPAGLFG
jgi:hypothetical protein